MNRLLAASCVAGLLLGVIASPAHASISSPAADAPLGWGTLMGASWVEHDPNNLLHRPGNTYAVTVIAEQNFLGRSITGLIDAYDCDPGEIIGGADPGPGQCDPVSAHPLHGTATTQMTFTAGTGSATLGGALQETTEAGTPVRLLPVAIAWTGAGVSSTAVYDFGFVSDDGTQYVIHGWRRNWNATLSGHLATFGVGDAGNELVSGDTARYAPKSAVPVG